MTFGKKLQSLRKEKGLSQDALANQLYVTRQSVSQWENDRTMPSVDLLIKISEIFDTTVDALLGKPETESIPQPMAQAKTLTDKKSIKTAMRYEYSTAVIVLVSMALLLLGMYAVMMFIENNIFSLTPEVLARLSGSIFNVWENILPAVLCAAAGGVLTIISFVHTRKAVEFGKKHACTLNFFYDHLVIAEEGEEPLSLFYTNIKQLVETDGYFIFKMQNKARFCVDKSELENPEELSKLLKSAKNYLDRRLSKTPAGMGKVKRCAVRVSRDFFFTASFFTPFYITLIFALVTTILTENQFVRFTVFIIPFLVVLAATVLGVVFTVRKIKAKRMIIAGGAAIVIFVVMNFAIYNASVIYNFQHDRVKPEQFVTYMEEHGLTVEDTIKGREELYISKCYTAKPKDNSFEITYLEFDEYSQNYGLFSARETAGRFLNEIRSQPRMTTRYTSQDLAFNMFYTETTNNHYAYVSLNEYSVIYFNAASEAEPEIKNVLKDFELSKPYVF